MVRGVEEPVERGVVEFGSVVVGLGAVGLGVVEPDVIEGGDLGLGVGPGCVG